MNGNINRDWKNVDWHWATSDFGKQVTVSATVNGTEILKRSQLADEVDCAARGYVDRIDRAYYGGRMPSNEAANLYRVAAEATVLSRMMEELSPLHKAAARMTFMFLHPAPEVPSGLQEVINAVVNKWKAVFREVTGDQIQ